MVQNIFFFDDSAINAINFTKIFFFQNKSSFTIRVQDKNNIMYVQDNMRTFLCNCNVFFVALKIINEELRIDAPPNLTLLFHHRN